MRAKSSRDTIELIKRKEGKKELEEARRLILECTQKISGGPVRVPDQEKDCPLYDQVYDLNGAVSRALFLWERMLK